MRASLRNTNTTGEGTEKTKGGKRERSCRQIVSIGLNGWDGEEGGTGLVLVEKVRFAVRLVGVVQGRWWR